MSVISQEASVGLDFSITVLGSGSSGNSSVVSCGDHYILIDAGFSAREIEKRMGMVGLDPSKLKAILITHEHADHIQSCHTLSRRFEAPILCTEGTFVNAIDGKKFYDWVQIHSGNNISIGPMAIHPIALPHDAADPVGFRIECNGRKLAHLTDFGYVSGLILESLKGCDALLVEANHDLEMLKNGPYPWPLKQRIAGRLGHLSNEAFLEMLPDILHDNVTELILAHMSHTNNDARLLTMQTKRCLRRLGLEQIPFCIAPQDEPLETRKI